MGKHHFSSSEHHIGRPIDYSTDAIVYVTVVVVFYAAIIILLLTTNFRRRKPSSCNGNGCSSGCKKHHGDGTGHNSHHCHTCTPSSSSTTSWTRKHWLFFNPISGEAQQATKKESQMFIHRQDAETV
ncbi:unnamed protein product [Orchesella dallaii]|uniref:Uncharacterized protein n=1 Tax=Orchesella dallaii TaxID=48710 RepID=A0ABP1Q251_9HEXA